MTSVESKVLAGSPERHDTAGSDCGIRYPDGRRWHSCADGKVTLLTSTHRREVDCLTVVGSRNEHQRLARSVMERTVPNLRALPPLLQQSD